MSASAASSYIPQVGEKTNTNPQDVQQDVQPKVPFGTLREYLASLKEKYSFFDMKILKSSISSGYNEKAIKRLTDSLGKSPYSLLDAFQKYLEETAEQNKLLENIEMNESWIEILESSLSLDQIPGAKGDTETLFGQYCKKQDEYKTNRMHFYMEDYLRQYIHTHFTQETHDLFKVFVGLKETKTESGETIFTDKSGTVIDSELYKKNTLFLGLSSLSDEFTYEDIMSCLIKKTPGLFGGSGLRSMGKEHHDFSRYFDAEYQHIKSSLAEHVLSMLDGDSFPTLEQWQKSVESFDLDKTLESRKQPFVFSSLLAKIQQEDLTEIPDTFLRPEYIQDFTRYVVALVEGVANDAIQNLSFDVQNYEVLYKLQKCISEGKNQDLTLHLDKFKDQNAKELKTVKFSCSVGKNLRQLQYQEPIKKILENEGNEKEQQKSIKNFKIQCEKHLQNRVILHRYYKEDMHRTICNELKESFSEKVYHIRSRLKTITFDASKESEGQVDYLYTLRQTINELSNQYAYKKSDGLQILQMNDTNESRKNIYASLSYEEQKLSSLQIEKLVAFDMQLQDCMREIGGDYQSVLSYRDEHPNVKRLVLERNRYLGDAIDGFFFNICLEKGFMSTLEYNNNILTDQFWNELVLSISKNYVDCNRKKLDIEDNMKVVSSNLFDTVYKSIPSIVAERESPLSRNDFAQFMEKSYFDSVVTQYRDLFVSTLDSKDLTKESLQNRVTETLQQSVLCLYEIFLTHHLFLKTGDANGWGKDELKTLFDCIVRSLTVYDSNTPKVVIKVGYGGSEADVIPRVAGYHGMSVIIANIFKKYGILADVKPFHAYNLSTIVNGLSSKQTDVNAQGVTKVTNTFVKDFLSQDVDITMDILDKDYFSFLKESWFVSLCDYIKEDYEYCLQDKDCLESDKLFTKQIQELMSRAHEHNSSDLSDAEALNRAIQYAAAHPIIFGDIYPLDLSQDQNTYLHTIKIGSEGERAFNVVQKRIANHIAKGEIKGWYIPNYVNGSGYSPLHRTSNGSSKPGYYPADSTEVVLSDIGKNVNNFDELKAKYLVSTEQNEKHPLHDARDDIEMQVGMIQYGLNCDKKTAEGKYRDFLMKCASKLDAPSQDTV